MNQNGLIIHYKTPDILVKIKKVNSEEESSPVNLT